MRLRPARFQAGRSEPRGALRAGLAALAAAPVVVVLATAAAAQTDVGLDDAGLVTTAGLWLARLGNHAAFVVLVGCLLAPAWLATADAHGVAAAWARRLVRPAAGVALLWAASGLALFAFGLSNAAALPLLAALDGELIGFFAATRFGTAVLAQAAWAVVVALLALGARRRPGAQIALAAAAFGALGPAWWGHAPGAAVPTLAVAGSWAHVVAVGAWIGGLGALVALLAARTRADAPAAVPAGGAGEQAPPTSGPAPRAVTPGEAPADLAEPGWRFSRLAGFAFAVVAVTGVVSVLAHTETPGQLWETAWGRLALAKAVLLVAVGALGYVHRRRSLPRLGGEVGAVRAFRRLAGVELAVMVAAVALAATMASGQPARVEAALQIQSVTTEFGDGQVSFTLDPARTGSNELHLYLLDAAGALRPVDEATLVLRAPDGQLVEPRLLGSGPGHYAALDVRLEQPGPYQVEIRATGDGRSDAAALTVTVR